MQAVTPPTKESGTVWPLNVCRRCDTEGDINAEGFCPDCEREVEDTRKQLAWMEEMERIEQEVFPDARPRSEVIVEVERPE
jgi:hypothetical protein